MKVTRLLSMAGFVGAALLIAPATEANTVVNVTGCLATGSQAHEYSIKDDNGTTYGLVPSNGINMKRHVGQKVLITGSEIKAKREQREAQQSGTPVDNEYLRVTHVTKVSTSCS